MILNQAIDVRSRTEWASLSPTWRLLLSGLVMTRSKFEADVIAKLQTSEAKFEYEPEWLSFTQPAKGRKYLPDIKLETKSGKIIYIELKGKLDIDTRYKMKWVKEQHPDKDIRIVFMRDNLMSKRGKRKTYSDWALDNGFLCAVGAVPIEWIDE